MVPPILVPRWRHFNISACPQLSSVSTALIHFILGRVVGASGELSGIHVGGATSAGTQMVPLLILACPQHNSVSTAPIHFILDKGDLSGFNVCGATSAGTQVVPLLISRLSAAELDQYCSYSLHTWHTDG